MKIVTLLAGSILKQAYTAGLTAGLTAVAAGDPAALDRTTDAFKTVCSTEL